MFFLLNFCRKRWYKTVSSSPFVVLLRLADQLKATSLHRFDYFCILAKNLHFEKINTAFLCRVSQHHKQMCPDSHFLIAIFNDSECFRFIGIVYSMIPPDPDDLFIRPLSTDSHHGKTVIVINGRTAAGIFRSKGCNPGKTEKFAAITETIHKSNQFFFIINPDGS